MKKKVPLDKAYTLINHGPTVLVTSFYKRKPNVQTVAWLMPLDFDPPKVALVIGEDNYSFECIIKTGEFVINIPTKELIKKVVQCGSISGRRVNKFKKFHLKTLPAKTVKPPLVADCIAHLECRLIAPALARKYNLFVAKVQYAWVEDSVYKKRLLVDRARAKTIHHLGGRIFMIAGEVKRAKM